MTTERAYSSLYSLMTLSIEDLKRQEQPSWSKQQFTSPSVSKDHTAIRTTKAPCSNEDYSCLQSDIVAKALNSAESTRSLSVGGTPNMSLHHHVNALQSRVEPRTIQVVYDQPGYVNHSYRDYSQVPPLTSYRDAVCVNEMDFARKLHHIAASRDSGLIEWRKHGRAFRLVLSSKRFQIMQFYFGHSDLNLFLQDLHNYGFRKMTRGRDRNCFYHECMLRGLPHLTTLIPPSSRHPDLLPMPKYEPKLYKISKNYPVPEASAENVLPFYDFENRGSVLSLNINSDDEADKCGVHSLMDIQKNMLMSMNTGH